MNYRIAIVGNRETVKGFALLGVDVKAVEGSSDALATLWELKRSMATDEHGTERPAYAIIFVTEDILKDTSLEEQKKLAKGALPAIIPLPTHLGSTGFGMSRLKRIVERAIGSDILQ